MRLCENGPPDKKRHILNFGLFVKRPSHTQLGNWGKVYIEHVCMHKCMQLAYCCHRLWLILCPYLPQAAVVMLMHSTTIQFDSFKLCFLFSSILAPKIESLEEMYYYSLRVTKAHTTYDASTHVHTAHDYVRELYSKFDKTEFTVLSVQCQTHLYSYACKNLSISLIA